MGLMDIRSVLGDLAAGRISAERIAFLKDQVDAVAKEKAALEQELAKAKEEIQQLRLKLHAQASAGAQDEFVEAAGALFKRKPGGGYHEVVFCPRCRTSVGCLEPIFPFLCRPCRWESPFKGSELPRILKGLPQ
jgi:hypothetical protein